MRAIDRSVTLLPDPDFADEPEDLARPHLEIDAVDGPDGAAAVSKVTCRSLTRSRGSTPTIIASRREDRRGRRR